MKSKYYQIILFTLLSIITLLPQGFVFAQTATTTQESLFIDQNVYTPMIVLDEVQSLAYSETDTTVEATLLEDASYQSGGLRYNNPLYVGSNVNGSTRSVLKFQLPEFTGTITRLRLKLYCQTCNWTKDFSIFSLTQNLFVDSQVSWTVYSTGNSWTNAGGDYNSPALGSFTAFPPNSSWTQWDLTIPEGLASGDTISFLIKLDDESTSDVVIMHAEEDANPPILEVSYAEGTGTATTSTDLMIYNGDMYIYIFFFSIVIYILAFWVTLKA